MFSIRRVIHNFSLNSIQEYLLTSLKYLLIVVLLLQAFLFSTGCLIDILKWKLNRVIPPN